MRSGWYVVGGNVAHSFVGLNGSGRAECGIHVGDTSQLRERTLRDLGDVASCTECIAAIQQERDGDDDDEDDSENGHESGSWEAT
jgi:hypothetical protein